MGERKSEDQTSAVAKYFGQSQPQLRAVVRSVVFNPTDVDDILQDVAVTAMEKAAQYDSTRTDIGAWIAGIARIHVRRFLEQQRKRRTNQPTFSSAFVDAAFEHSIGEVETPASLTALRDCLRRLDPEQQQLLLRRHEPEMSATRLARETGYTDSRLSRTLNSLYAVLMKCIQSHLNQ